MLSKKFPLLLAGSLAVFVPIFVIVHWLIYPNSYLAAQDRGLPVAQAIAQEITTTIAGDSRFSQVSVGANRSNVGAVVDVVGLVEHDADVQFLRSIATAKPYTKDVELTFRVNADGEAYRFVEQAKSKSSPK